MFNQEELKFIQAQLQENQEDISITIKEKIEDLIVKVADNKMNLYSFYWDCGRMGELNGVFKATQEQVDCAIGNHAYFGEVLGKYSEVEGIVEEDEITLISDDPIKVINSVESGFNPLEYMRYECSKCKERHSSYEFDDLENMICGYCASEDAEEEQASEIIVLYDKNQKKQKIGVIEMSKFIEIGNSIFNKGEICSIIKASELNLNDVIEYSLKVTSGYTDVDVVFHSEEARDDAYEDVISLLDVDYYDDQDENEEEND